MAETQFAGEPPVGRTSASEAGPTRRCACLTKRRARRTPPDNPLQTAPFLIARHDDARAKPTHARALRRRRRSLARSIARARCGSGGSVWLHRPSRALCAPRVTGAYTYVITAHRARHHRFPPPPCTTGTRALQRRRRSLARCAERGGVARSAPHSPAPARSSPSMARKWSWRRRWREGSQNTAM